MNDENKSFFDSRTLLAVILIGLTFIGWQNYMQRKYPETYKKKTEQSAEAPQTSKPEDLAKAETSANPPEQAAMGAAVPDSTSALPEETLVHYESENLTFCLSSRGMGLKNLYVRKYKDRKGEVIQLGHPEQEKSAPLETRLLGRPEPLHFNIEKVNENLYVGRARVGGMEVTKTVEIIPERYLINTRVATSGMDDRFVGLTTMLTEEVANLEKPSFLLPTFDLQEFYVETADTTERVTIAQEDAESSWSKAKIASVGSQYFTQAVIDKSPVMPDIKATVNHKNVTADVVLQYPILNRNDSFQLEYSAFIGPKAYQLMRNIDPQLAGVVNFGWFNWIARQIFSMLTWFHVKVGNWGWAIILLTIVVRLMVLPFNVYSYKSMKKMQAIQPLINALRERYKDDQQKQQQEMMRLMRENKVNPVGGCLPVLLQFPIFIALYQVLGHSIELYQAPFALWIHDLSLKDPYYILPVLMGVTMFIQQKITPTTMDPAQAKIMLMMPVIFTFFMVGLPSGLTLYMLVGAVFSVGQQLFFMRDSKPLQPAPVN